MQNTMEEPTVAEEAKVLPLPSTERRLFVGGLFPEVTKDELHQRFVRFGNVKSIEIKIRKDYDGSPLKTFAYVDMESSDTDFKKLMSSYNKTRWKGSELKIQRAKDNFLLRLEKERQEAKTMTTSEKSENERRKKMGPSNDVQNKLLDIAGVGNVSNMKPTGAKPGDTVPGHKDWIVGKYGRVLPIVQMKRNGKSKPMKIDPSKYTHTVKKIKETVDVPVTCGNLTWQLADRDNELTRKRKGEFPVWRPEKKRCSDFDEIQSKLQEIISSNRHADYDIEMEIVPVGGTNSETKNNTVINKKKEQVTNKTDLENFDSDSDNDVIRTETNTSSHGNTGMDLSRFDSDSENDDPSPIRVNAGKSKEKKMDVIQTEKAKTLTNKLVVLSTTQSGSISEGKVDSSFANECKTMKALIDTKAKTAASKVKYGPKLKLIDGKKKLKAFGGLKSLPVSVPVEPTVQLVKEIEEQPIIEFDSETEEGKVIQSKKTGTVYSSSEEDDIAEVCMAGVSKTIKGAQKPTFYVSKKFALQYSYADEYASAIVDGNETSYYKYEPKQISDDNDDGDDDDSDFETFVKKETLKSKSHNNLAKPDVTNIGPGHKQWSNDSSIVGNNKTATKIELTPQIILTDKTRNNNIPERKTIVKDNMSANSESDNKVFGKNTIRNKDTHSPGSSKMIDGMPDDSSDDSESEDADVDDEPDDENKEKDSVKNTNLIAGNIKGVGIDAAVDDDDDDSEDSESEDDNRNGAETLKSGTDKNNSVITDRNKSDDVNDDSDDSESNDDDESDESESENDDEKTAEKGDDQKNIVITDGDDDVDSDDDESGDADESNDENNKSDAVKSNIVVAAKDNKSDPIDDDSDDSESEDDDDESLMSGDVKDSNVNAGIGKGDDNDESEDSENDDNESGGVENISKVRTTGMITDVSKDASDDSSDSESEEDDVENEKVEVTGGNNENGVGSESEDSSSSDDDESDSDFETLISNAVNIIQTQPDETVPTQSIKTHGIIDKAESTTSSKSHISRDTSNETSKVDKIDTSGVKNKLSTVRKPNNVKEDISEESEDGTDSESKNTQGTMETVKGSCKQTESDDSSESEESDAESSEDETSDDMDVTGEGKSDIVKRTTKGEGKRVTVEGTTQGEDQVEMDCDNESSSSEADTESDDEVIDEKPATRGASIKHNLDKSAEKGASIKPNVSAVSNSGAQENQKNVGLNVMSENKLNAQNKHMVFESATTTRKLPGQSENKGDTDKKRLEAVKLRQKENKAQNALIQNALANLDKGKPASNKIVFGSDSEDDTVAMDTSQVAMDTSQKKSSSEYADTLAKLGFETEGKGKSLFDSSDDDSDDSEDGDRFKIRQEFEGEGGKKLATLQSRYGNDERFKLDSRFIESGSEDEEPEMELEDETQRSLKILQSVVGVKAMRGVSKMDKAKKKFKDIGTLKYDPTKEEHQQQFEIKTKVKEQPPVEDKKTKKKKKKKDRPVEEVPEVVLPEVSSEKFFEVSDSLKNTFIEKAQSETQNEAQTGTGFSLLSTFGKNKSTDVSQNEAGTGTGFSLLSMFGRHQSDDEADDMAEDAAIPIPTVLRSNPMSLDNRFKVMDDTDDESGGDNPQSTVDKISAGSDNKMDTTEANVEAASTVSKVSKPSTFFFLPDDVRLKGTSPKPDQDMDRREWVEKRRHLIDCYKSKYKNYKRKHKDGNNRGGKPRHRGGRRK